MLNLLLFYLVRFLIAMPFSPELLPFSPKSLPFSPKQSFHSSFPV